MRVFLSTNYSIVNMTELPVNDNILVRVMKLCSYLHKKFSKKYLMDNLPVTAAIKNNESAMFTKLTNNFIQDALSHIEEVGPRFENIKQSLKNSTFMIDVASNCHTFPLKNKCDDWNAKRLIMIQLAIWSSISSESFKYIATMLLHFWSQKIDVKQMDENEIWLWLHCLTTCIVSTTRCVYEIYATDLYSKNPLCQLLLLDVSIHHNSLPFMHYGINPYGHEMGIDEVSKTTGTKNNWTHLTDEFVNSLNQSKLLRKSLLSDENKSLGIGLRFFGEWGKPGVPTSTKISFTMNHFIQKSASIKIERNKLGEIIKLQPKDTIMSIAGATYEAAIEPTSLILPAKMSKATHKSLQKDLNLLMKKMEEYNICTCLSNIFQLQLPDINNHNKLLIEKNKVSYIKCCDEFAETEFPNLNANVLNYMKKMTLFSGLLIYDYLQNNLSKDIMLDHKSVLAHVLKYCLNGSKSKGKFQWQLFFRQLIPQSAFNKNETVEPNLRFLSLYLKTCMDKMSIEKPSKIEIFQFYFQNNYFSDMNLMNENVINDTEKNKVQNAHSVVGESNHTPIKSNKMSTQKNQVTSKDQSNLNQNSKEYVSTYINKTKRKEVPTKTHIDTPSESNNKKLRKEISKKTHTPSESNKKKPSKKDTKKTQTDNHSKSRSEKLLSFDFVKPLLLSRPPTGHTTQPPTRPPTASPTRPPTRVSQRVAASPAKTDKKNKN